MNMKRTMKLVGILIASIALVACGGGGSDPVKTVKVYRLVKVVTEDDDGTTVEKETAVSEYDNNGILLKKNIDSDYNGDGNIDAVSYIDYIYDDEGLLLTTKTYNKNDEDQFKLYLETTYDEHGNPTHLNWDTDLDGSFVISTHAYKYENGVKIEDKYSENGIDILFISTYTYDGTTVVESVDGFPFGSIDRLNTYTYDEAGNLEERYFYQPVDDGMKRGHLIYDITYDENGNIFKGVSDWGNHIRTETYAWKVFNIPEK